MPRGNDGTTAACVRIICVCVHVFCLDMRVQHESACMCVRVSSIIRGRSV